MNKFPHALKYLHQHLGQANTKRRQLFAYYEQHRSKITQCIDAAPDPAPAPAPLAPLGSPNREDQGALA